MIKVFSGAYLSLVVGAIMGFLISNISSIVPLGVTIFVFAALIALCSFPLCFLLRKHKEYLDLYLGIVFLSISLEVLLFSGILQIYKFHVIILCLPIVLSYILSFSLWDVHIKKVNSKEQSKIHSNKFSVFMKTGTTIALVVGSLIGGAIIRVSTQKTLYNILNIICIMLAFGLQFGYINLFTRFNEQRNKS